ncbi:MAG: ATP-binding protein [Deltaproteobacteria bacterium]|nr:ATP-binding protein [Deltaproteobacteria bacterium]
MRRYAESQIRKDLARKMVFVAGPRQCGKTTLAKQILKAEHGDLDRYFNWDDQDDRARLLERRWPSEGGIVVFDELHKYLRWRNLLKGLFDKRGDDLKILVTGSARLDHYRRGGDSLQGRYHLLRMHPLSVAELGASQTELETMLHLGGFPEPYLSGSEVEAKRWSRDYRVRLVREELASLERVLELALVEQLLHRLPECVGSPLSLNALREDLQVSQPTVARWVTILENLFALFRLPPFGAPRIRAVKKEQKHYHFDWTVVPSQAARFENLVAAHLLKWCHWQEDTRGEDTELRYFRDVDKREVDFVIVQNRKPIRLIECKLSAGPIDSGLRYLHQRFPAADAWQIHLHGKDDYRSEEGIRVAPALKLLGSLV